MRLVVGLGNPGTEYEKTRHNIGFMYFDYILDSDKFKLNKKFNAYEYQTNINGEKVLFIKPLSFMNLSGEVVKKYVQFYKIESSSVLVIQDDMDMELGRYKLLKNHGDGGHNGIKNIISFLGTKDFLRLKIGISKNNGDKKEYVLGKFSRREITVLNSVFGGLNNFIEDYVSMNTDLLINKYNSH